MTDALAKIVVAPGGGLPDLRTQLHYRPGTRDEDVLNEVYVGDEYRALHNGEIREAIRDQVIIDAGANIGAFSVLALELGARAVIAIEPEDENRRLLVRNIERWADRVVVLPQAVGDPDLTPTVRMDGTSGSARAVPGADVPVVSFPQVLERALELGPWVGMLKIDVEGGEYPWLSTALGSLNGVDRIALEWHAHRPNGSYLPSDFGELATTLAWTHSISAFGVPDRGGLLYAHPYTHPRDRER